MIPEFDRATVSRILQKFGRDNRAQTIKLPLLTFDSLYKELTLNEAEAVNQLMNIDPKVVGFTGPFIGLNDPPPKFSPVDNQSFRRDGSIVSISAQYLNDDAYQAYMNMKTALSKEIGSDIMVESGYRSPAHQVITFFTYLEIFEYDIFYVAKGVALPGFSQHGDPVNTALDLINQEGIPNDLQPQFFASTPEYDWLTRRAADFGYKLSYPTGNADGVKFEPWHWRYCP